VVLPEVALVVGLLAALVVLDGPLVTVVAVLDILLGTKELVTLGRVELDVDVVVLGTDMI
jgi:hypothetical protein